MIKEMTVCWDSGIVYLADSDRELATNQTLDSAVAEYGRVRAIHRVVRHRKGATDASRG